jgi:hypothetical protein
MAPDGTVVDSPATPPPTSSGAAPDPNAQPSAGVTKPAASQPDYKWEEDTRTKGTLEDLKKERKARQDYEGKIKQYEADLAEQKRRVSALTGNAPLDPKAADAELVRSKILELMPELADLGSIAEMREALEEQQVQGHATHARRMIAQIHQGIAAEYGDLTDRQKRRINAAYLYENQTNPEFHARHNQGDPALIAEFVKEMIEDLVDPIKRKVTTAEATRFRPVPGGRDRSTPLKGEKPKTSEEMLRAKFKAAAR